MKRISFLKLIHLAIEIATLVVAILMLSIALSGHDQPKANIEADKPVYSEVYTA